MKGEAPCALAAFLAESMATLQRAGIESASLDARLLTGHVLHLDRAQLLSQSNRLLTAEEQTSIRALLARRATHESVARLIGHREFWGLDFGLNEATLEPRPDSETLVEAVLSALSLPLAGRVREGGSAPEQTLIARAHPFRLLDLGTGSGCLLLALLHDIPNATGLGLDINPRAIEQATLNAVALDLQNRATFRLGNWLEGVTEKFDLIVSNPPYIPSSDIPALMPEVRNYDPLLALDGGTDGLAPYRHLAPQLGAHLNPNGRVAFEVGQGQAQDVAALLRANGFVSIQIHKDLGEIDRCVTASKQAL